MNPDDPFSFLYTDTNAKDSTGLITMESPGPVDVLGDVNTNAANGGSLNASSGNVQPVNAAPASDPTNGFAGGFVAGLGDLFSATVQTVAQSAANQITASVAPKPAPAPVVPSASPFKMSATTGVLLVAAVLVVVVIVAKKSD